MSDGPTEPLTLWVVYERPADYPEGYIARQWQVHTGVAFFTSLTVTAPTLEGVRRKLPSGLVPFERDPNDDPCVKEVWI